MNKLNSDTEKRFEDAEFYYHIHQGYVGSVKQFISQEKQLSKQEERARIIPKIHKIRAGCPAKSFARQQAKELLKELMGVEK